MPLDEAAVIAAIELSLTEPKSVSTDGQSYEAHALKDQLAALTAATTGTASENPHRGIRFTKLVPPGAT